MQGALPHYILSNLRNLLQNNRNHSRQNKACNCREDNLHRGCPGPEFTLEAYAEPLTHSSADWHQEEQMHKVDSVASLRHRK